MQFALTLKSSLNLVSYDRNPMTMSDFKLKVKIALTAGRNGCRDRSICLPDRACRHSSCESM